MLLIPLDSFKQYIAQLMRKYQNTFLSFLDSFVDTAADMEVVYDEHINCYIFSLLNKPSDIALKDGKGGLKRSMKLKYAKLRN